MTKPAEKSRRPEAPAPARRVAPRRATADRRLRILERLTTGPTGTRIARAEGLTVTRIRRIIAQMLESREIDPPAGFVQIQIARLSEAMIVGRTMTSRAMRAMDRLMKPTGELDRYHGFGKPPVSLPSVGSPPRRLAGPRRELTAPNSAPSEAETKVRLEMAPQHIEKIESALENGSMSEPSKLQDVVHRRALTVRSD
jgi:hypothetical protein